MTLVEAIEITRNLLDSIEVKGAKNVKALTLAINNLDEIKKFLEINKKKLQD